MKAIVFVAILALAWAAEKPEEPREEKKGEEHRGLQWPLPDPRNEGDLMLHGAHFYERVGELRKAKVENEMDKMILAFGRIFLRKAHKYLEATPEFKIPAVLCHDTRALNSSDRWEIRIQAEQHPAADSQPEQGKEAENKPAQGEQPKQQQQQQQQNDAPTKQNDVKVSHPKDVKSKADDQKPNVNTTNENATEAPIQKPERIEYEAQRADHYRHVGENFARILLKKFHKETLIAEETEYLEHWLNDEAVHYGVMGIYCHESENINVKDLVKKISTYVEEK